ncbi:MAG: ABC transporter ATP-binding protein [Treponema sp.]|nr:ABC transporter ATP-binding protein [Treponema sp.]
MLEIKNLCAGYNGSAVLRNIHFTVTPGDFFCVLGPNGCGKSTLLKTIARLINYQGQICLNEKNISALSRKELAAKISLLEQSQRFFFSFSVQETVSMGRYPYSKGFLKDLSGSDKTVIEKIMHELDIWDIKDRITDEISGGQLQRVFLARALAQTPEVILLDEPTNNLDLKYQIELFQFLKSWVKENKTMLIAVCHDLNLARFFGDSAIVIHNSAIAANGNVNEILDNKIMQSVYGIDVRAFMLESLEKWK